MRYAGFVVLLNFVVDCFLYFGGYAAATPNMEAFVQLDNNTLTGNYSLIQDMTANGSSSISSSIQYPDSYGRVQGGVDAVLSFLGAPINFLTTAGMPFPIVAIFGGGFIILGLLALISFARGGGTDL